MTGGLTHTCLSGSVKPPAERLANRKKRCDLNAEILYNCVILEDYQLDGIAILPSFQFLSGELSAAACPTSSEQNPG